MTPFKRFFTEAISIADAKKHKLSRKTSGAYTNNTLNDVFGNEDRLIYNIDINRLKIEDHPLMVGINEFLKSLNDNGLLPSIYSIPDMESYVEGIAYPTKDTQRKQPNKIGRIFNKIASDNSERIPAHIREKATELANGFRDDPLRSARCDEYKIIISRHPYDIAGMSTDRSWWSCMHLGSRGINYKTKDAGSNSRFIQGDIKEGSVIAYLICSNDKHSNGKYAIKKPFSRILMKPHVSLDEEGNRSYAYTIGMIYGAPIPEFHNFVKRWISEKLNKDTEGKEFHRPKSLYRDQERDRPVGFNLFDHATPVIYKQFLHILQNNTNPKYYNNFDINVDSFQKSRDYEAVLTVKFNIPRTDVFTHLKPFKYSAGKPIPLYLRQVISQINLNYNSANPKVVFDMVKYGEDNTLSVFFTLKDVENKKPVDDNGNVLDLSDKDEMFFWRAFFNKVGIDNINYEQTNNNILNIISEHLMDEDEDF
jgi:hypothetical protein